MTDQGWGSADGSARGSATGNRGGSEDGRGGGVDTRKVVPFPREWYGSPDELVPIDLGEPEVDATGAAETDATEAAAFWEGGAGGDHELTEPSDARLHDPATSDMAPHTERAPSDRLKPSKPASRRRTVRSLAVAASLALVFAGVATVLVSGLGAGPGTGLGTRTQRQAASRAVTHTVTTPVTVTTTVPARGHRENRPTTQTRFGNAAGGRADSGTPVVQQLAAGTQPAAGTDEAPSSVTTPPPATGGGSQNSGTGCAESPDSGCLP